ncbi:MAG: MFS transporter, partial [Acidimicrobiia bacterium]
RAMSLYTLAFVGFIPVGSILAGVVAAAIGAQETVLALSAAGVALGLGAGRFGIPVLTEVRPPEFTREVELGDHVATAEGGPVMVVSTWVIDPADLEDFLAALSELRLVRLRTGAYRWRLYRNAGNPRRLTEVFLVASWEDHLAQHRRIDDLSAEVIRRSRAFDRADGPITHHLVAVDVLDPEDRPDWDALLAAHGRLHETDGSIPLPAEG